MLTIPSKPASPDQGPPLNELQRQLVENKFEMLQGASFGFTQDRLLHIQERDLKTWTHACTDELRRAILSVAPPHVEIVLIHFPELRCVSLQCRPLPPDASGARAR